MITFSVFLEEIGSNIWYHGSNNSFENFKLGRFKKDQQLGFGIHFAKDKDFAKLYGQYIYYCQLSPVKTLDETKIHSTNSEEYQFAQELYKRSRYRLLTSDNQFALRLDVAQPKRVYELLLKYGYDSVLYDAKYGSSAIGGMHVTNKSLSMVMLDANKIKIENIANEYFHILTNICQHKCSKCFL